MWIKVTKDKKYYIPRDTRVIGNIMGINNDKNYWEIELGGKSVEQFDPKRFLDTTDPLQTKLLSKTKLATFGAGRRNCPGQNLAKREMLLVLALLIERYKFDIPSYCKGACN